MFRFLTISLVFILLFPLLGHLGVFQVRKWQIRHTLKEKLMDGLPKEELSLVKIPQQWLDKAPKRFKQVERKEFRLDGEMYDIVYQEQHGDTLWNYCVHDEAETILFAQLDIWIQEHRKHDPFQTDRQLQLERLWQSLFEVSIPNLFEAEHQTYAASIDNYQLPLESRILEVDSPPPEV